MVKISIRLDEVEKELLQRALKEIIIKILMDVY